MASTAGDSVDTIIFDIDGTLADLTHRRHHVTGGRREWPAFFDAMGDDTPTEVVWLAERLAAAPGDFAVFVFSGRPDTHRHHTEAWLEKHAPGLLARAEAVMMRPGGDYRPDTEIKREMLAAIRSQGFEPRLVVDDRPTVVQMWKDEGLTVLEVDSGEWDDAPKGTPGRLVLLVGPSGAGKSTYAARTFPADVVLSSDVIRQTLCGDFQDQSRNPEVFAALHALVETRIRHGLLTVVDATNLRNRDRRSLLDLMPPGAAVEYHIVDRPMAEKVRDAGWRAEISIKGVSLLDKHDQTFRSNLKDILAGDGDPRVTVHDVRGMVCEFSA